MGFDFVNTKLIGVTGPQSVLSASVSYAALNANVQVSSVNTLGQAASASLIVRNGLIVGALNLTSSTQPF